MVCLQRKTTHALVCRPQWATRLALKAGIIETVQVSFWCGQPFLASVDSISVILMGKANDNARHGEPPFLRFRDLGGYGGLSPSSDRGSRLPS